jgi:hypothetical protein
VTFSNVRYIQNADFVALLDERLSSPASAAPQPERPAARVPRKAPVRRAVRTAPKPATSMQPPIVGPSVPPPMGQPRGLDEARPFRRAGDGMPINPMRLQAMPDTPSSAADRAPAAEKISDEEWVKRAKAALLEHRVVSRAADALGTMSGGMNCKFRRITGWSCRDWLKQQPVAGQ